MTREEATRVLYVYCAVNLVDESHREAFDTAIKALEQQEPCTDAISRQAVLDYIEGSEAELGHSSENELVCHDIKELPPIQPKAKVGKWIKFKDFENGYYHIKCSECGQYWSVDGHAKIFKHCFNCGAEMQEVKE